eukprot:6565963-Prorocentrum_lima.AAC.1
MTSSLVGSEMCIRDRNSVGEPLRSQSESSDLERPSPMVLAPVVLTSPSVSYTHLTLPTICSV